jgi:hypothetical protein
MNLPPAARAATRPSIIAALTATAAMAIAAGMAAAPAHAATTPTPPTLPAQLTAAIGAAGLSVQVDNGWEAATGPAATVTSVQALATSLSIGTLAEYSGNNETGQAILIFSGSSDPSSLQFQVNGGTADSADNNTNQTWYIDTNAGQPDATITPGTAENITPVDSLWTLAVGPAINAAVAVYNWATG